LYEFQSFRAKFAAQCVSAVVAKIWSRRAGVNLIPYGMGHCPENQEFCTGLRR
jgi:hypothetical protein